MIRKTTTAALLSTGLILVISLTGCGENIPEVDGIEVEVTEENFGEVVAESSQPVLVDFGATWCGPCREMEPKVAYLSVQYEDKITVGKVDCDESPNLANEYEIDGVPAFLLFQNGEVVAQTTGSMSYASLSRWVEQHAGL